MLQEKPDNALPWRDRLEQLERLPEEHPANNSQLWEKLHGRMQQAPRNTGRNWYWLAAACLVFVFLLPLLRMNKKPQVLVRSKTVERQQKNAMPKQPVLVTQPTGAVQLQGLKKHVAKTYSHRKIKSRRILQAAVPASTPGIKPQEPLVQPAIPGLTIPISRDSVLIVSSQPEKKKLRVVHINELEQPLLQNLQSGSKHATAVFQKQRSRPFQPGSFEFGGNTSEEILKIKLSPSN
ncbi:MAG TPA: hypothetical protein VEZ17_08270 [Chitinophagaceae bacterium]|nr:hypothetical protein [Chitinophagaceae bacterium]